MRPVPFRGFIAVEVPLSEALDELLRELRTSGAGLKVVSAENLHTTLKFLGETEDGLVPDIMEAIRRGTADVRTFPARLRGTGAFPSLARMNVAWIRIEGAEPLGRIAADLEASLERLGFRRESRPWSAHVTVARVKGGRNLDRVRQILRAHETTVFAEWTVDKLRLKRSVLTPDGPTYTTVAEVPLTPPG